MRGCLALTPQVINAAFISKELQAALLSQFGDSFQLTKEDWSDRKILQTAFTETPTVRKPFWGGLVWANRIRATLFNRRAPESCRKR